MSCQVRSGLQHSEHQMNSAPVASGQSRKVVLQADIEEMKASISSATQELQLLQAQVHFSTLYRRYTSATMLAYCGVLVVHALPKGENVFYTIDQLLACVLKVCCAK